jgi:hypothetical protein
MLPLLMTRRHPWPDEWHRLVDGDATGMMVRAIAEMIAAAGVAEPRRPTLA